MAARIRLVDLPDEMLCEILTHVPYDYVQWPKLRFVNRRFRRIVSEESFERKVAATQFYNVYHLLPGCWTKSTLLFACKEWSYHFQDSVQSFWHITGQARDLVELGKTFACLMRIRIQHTTLEYVVRRQHKLRDPHVEVYLLRLLRLLPPGVKKLLRYSALKSYEQFQASFLDAEPQEDGFTFEVLRAVHNFLDFEHFHTHGAMSWSPFGTDYHTFIENIHKKPMKQELLIAKTGEYTSSMVMITRALDYLSSTPYAYMITTYDDLFGPRPYDAKNEAIQQLILTKQLCKDLEAENCKKIGQMLIDLDPKIWRPIMLEQEQFIASLNSEAELYECLCDEIKLLMAKESGGMEE